MYHVKLKYALLVLKTSFATLLVDRPGGIISQNFLLELIRIFFKIFSEFPVFGTLMRKPEMFLRSIFFSSSLRRISLINFKLLKFFIKYKDEKNPRKFPRNSEKYCYC